MKLIQMAVWKVYTAQGVDWPVDVRLRVAEWSVRLCRADSLRMPAKRVRMPQDRISTGGSLLRYYLASALIVGHSERFGNTRAKVKGKRIGERRKWEAGE